MPAEKVCPTIRWAYDDVVLGEEKDLNGEDIRRSTQSIVEIMGNARDGMEIEGGY